MKDRMKPGRQTRLAEIGTEGQNKLFRASAKLRSSDPDARVIERRYLEGAGVSIDEASDVEKNSAVDLSSFASPSARAVAEGALNALATVRAILEIA